MKFEIRWTADDKPMARRVDGCAMSEQDRHELRDLIQKMSRREVCFNCGAPWVLFTNAQGKKFFVCWACTKSV
jgi:hypothetical protein